MASLEQALLISDIEQQLDWLANAAPVGDYFFILSCLDVRD